MHKILIAILISMLVAEMAFAHWKVGREMKKQQKRKRGEWHQNNDAENLLRMADAELLDIRKTLHTFPRQEKRDREENPWKQERDESEYQREADAQRRASQEDYASMKSNEERKAS